MPLASQAELKRLEDSTYDIVRANPFRNMDGKVTWDIIEEFEEYSRDGAIIHQPSYGFTEEFGLCYLVMTPEEYLAETDVEPEFEYPKKPELLPEGFEDMDEDALKLAEESGREKQGLSNAPEL